MQSERRLSDAEKEKLEHVKRILAEELAQIREKTKKYSNEMYCKDLLFSDMVQLGEETPIGWNLIADPILGISTD